MTKAGDQKLITRCVRSPKQQPRNAFR